MTSKKGEPLNKKNIYIAKTSPPDVSKAYYSQFTRDFMLFLRSRAKEMVAGGRMVLTLQGSKSDDPDSVFELLGSTLHTMVLEVNFTNMVKYKYILKSSFGDRLVIGCLFCTREIKV